MEVTFDPAKNERNIRERGLSFERVAEFDFETAVRFEDTRQDYGERRLLARRLLGPAPSYSLFHSDGYGYPRYQFPARKCQGSEAIWQSENP